MSRPLTNPTPEEDAPAAGRSRLAKMLHIEWLGQMAASLFWIVSVLSYGISSTGDWLQMCAACSWLIANIASIVKAETK